MARVTMVVTEAGSVKNSSSVQMASRAGLAKRTAMTVDFPTVVGAVEAVELLGYRDVTVVKVEVL